MFEIWLSKQNFTYRYVLALDKWGFWYALAMCEGLIGGLNNWVTWEICLKKTHCTLVRHNYRRKSSWKTNPLLVILTAKIIPPSKIAKKQNSVLSNQHPMQDAPKKQLTKSWNGTAVHNKRHRITPSIVYSELTKYCRETVMRFRLRLPRISLFILVLPCPLLAWP